MVFSVGLTAHADLEGAADRAVAAAAIDEILRRDGLFRAAREIAHPGDDAVALFDQGFEAAAIPQRDRWPRQHEIAQDRIEKQLAAALRPLRADRRWRAAAMARALDPPNLLPVKTGDIERGVRKIGRGAVALHLLGNAPAPQ